MGVRPDRTTDDESRRAPLNDAGQTLAAFYDRRAPAALAYCARVCAPEAIADAVEEAFGEVFAAAAGGEAVTEDALERRLRAAVRSAAAKRVPGSGGSGLSGRLFERSKQRFAEAERAYDALAGDDAPALGRSLLAEMIEAEPLPEFDFAPATRVIPVPADALAGADAEPEPEPEPEPATVALSPAEIARRDPAVTSADTADFSPVRRRRLPLPRLSPRVRKRLAITMLVVGLLLVAEAIVTVAWKEPFTGYLAAQAQDDLSKDLDKLDKQAGGLDASEQRSLAAIRSAAARSRERMSLLAARLDRNVAEGEALGRIKIDRIGIDYVFVQGTAADSLRKGPGHYHPDTRLPGQGGTVGIAGHRTTYEAPFRKVDELKAGDKITLRMPYGLFTYEVTGHRIVPADYTQAFAGGGSAGGGEQLVLSACHPLYSATERILVEAKLVSSTPLGAAVETQAPAQPDVTARVLAGQRTARRLKLLGDRQLGQGMTGADVRELQRLLGMPVTGVFDANTTAAVLAFQRDHGLPQVGRAGSQTKRALARRPHPPSRPPTPAAVPQQQPSQPGYGNGQGTGTTPQGTSTAPPAVAPQPQPPPAAPQSPQGTGPGSGGTGR